MLIRKHIHQRYIVRTIASVASTAVNNIRLVVDTIASVITHW